MSIRMQNDHIHRLKMLPFMSEFHGLWTHHNYLACTKSVSLQTVQVEHYTEDKKKKNPCPQFGTPDYTFMSSLILMVILKFVTHVQWHWFRVCSSSTCFIITCAHVELSQEILVGSKFSGGRGSHLVLSMLCSNLTPNNGNSDCTALQAGESRMDSCNVHPNSVTAILCKLGRAECTVFTLGNSVTAMQCKLGRAECTMFTPAVWLHRNASWVEQNGQCSPQQCDWNAMQAG